MMLYKRLAKKFSSLKIDLIHAGMGDSPEDFIKKRFRSSLFSALVLSLVVLLVFLRIDITPFLILLVFPVIFFILFMIAVKGAKSRASKIVREIDNDIVYAGRFMLIELNAGVPLFDAIKNASMVYKGIGKPFRSIIEKVNIGKQIEQALVEVIEMTPSMNLRKMLWQIMNSLKTGGNINEALSSIIKQLEREQIISVKAYSKKLNAMVMFYLMIAIIAPSLGITILSLVSIFMKISLGLGNLMAVAFFVFLIQIMFLSIIKSSRPGVVI